MVSWLLRAYLLASLGQSLAVAPDWDGLKRQVGGRLFSGVPFAKPCFSQFDSSECLAVRQKYLDERKSRLSFLDLNPFLIEFQ